MKKKIVLTALIAGLSLCGNALAATELNYGLSIDQESRVVSVDVTLEGDNGGTAATGLVKNGNGDIVYAAQGFTDKNGKFSFSYVNNDSNGSYTVKVAAPREGLEKSDSFKMVTDQMVSAISGMTKNSAGIQSIIETYGEYMNLDMTAFNALADKTAVYEFMASDPYVNLNSVKTITDGFYGAVIVRTIAEGGGTTAYMNFLNNDAYGILSKDGIPTGESESLFDELDATVKDGVLKAVCAKAYTSVNQLSDTLEFYVLEQSLEKAVQWTEVHPVMVKYKDAGLLNVDFSVYNTLTNPQTADTAMMGRTDLYTYTDVGNAFSAAVAAANVGNTGTSGGGSGGGGGMVIPSVKVPEPVEKDNQAAASKFNDMDDYMWANEAVTYLADKGIISGMGDGSFAPANGLTREEVSTIIVKTQKLETEGKHSDFVDVPSDRWSYPYVSAVYEAGLMVGVSDNEFGANSKITRNEFAAIMKRLIDMYDAEITFNERAEAYDDADEIPEWAKESVTYMKGTGLMLGNTGNRFDGNEVITRAYACDVLYSVLNAVNYDAEV